MDQDQVDLEILKIQKSTKSSVGPLCPIHDRLRMKYGWYYKWHLNPWSSKVHYGVLTSYALLILVFSLSIISSNINPSKAGIDFAPEIVDKNIDYSSVYASVPKGSTEILEKRTENTKVFQTSDEQQKYIISSGPLHYKNGDKWSNIDSTIQPTDDGFRMDKSIYSATFGKSFLADPLVQIQKDGQNLSVKPGELSFLNGTENLSILTPKDVVGEENGHQVTYKNAYGPGLDFGYETQDLQLNKKLLINSFESLPQPTIDMSDEAKSHFKLELGFGVPSGAEIFIDSNPWDGKEVTTENSNLIFKKDGKTIWQLTPAMAWDNQGTDKAIAGKTTIAKVGDQLSVSVLFPYSWLKSAQYPVTIDPDTYYGATTDGYITGKANNKCDTAPNYDTAHSTGNLGPYTAGPTYTTMIVGQKADLECYIYRGFIEFDTSAIDDAATVSQANLYLKAAADNSTAAEFSVRVHKANWTSPLDTTNRDANYDAAIAATDGAVDWKSTSDGDFAVNTYFSSANLDTTWIQKDTTKTQFALVSSRDVAQNIPVGYVFAEWLTIHSQDAAEGNRPYLSVTAAVPAVTRYWIDADGGNWNDTANWSAASGGEGGASVPVAGDTAVFDNAGGIRNGALTIDTAVEVATLDFQAAYTGTITQGANTITTSTAMNLTGTSLTMGAGVTASGTLTIAADKTLDLNGNALSVTGAFTNNGNLQLKGSETITGTPTLASGSTVTYNDTAASSQAIKNWSYQNLTISASGGSYKAPTANVSVAGAFNLAAGTYNTSDGSTVRNLTVSEISTIAGTLTANSATISAAGDWTNTGTFTANTSTVALNGTADQTITTNGQAFNILTLNNTGASGSDDVIISGALDVNGLLTITDGDLDISTNDPNVNIAGGMTVGANGSIDLSAYPGTWTYDGSGTLTDSRATIGDLGTFVVDGTAAELTLGSNIKATGITVGADDTLNLGAGGYSLSITGSGTPLTVNGTFNKGTNSTVVYSGTSATNITAVAYNNLQLSGAATYTLANNLTDSNALAGNLTIANGATLDAGNGFNYGIALAGSWANAGTFTARSGTVTFNGTAAGKTINQGASNFNAITINGSGGEWTLNTSNLTAAALTVTAGTLNTSTLNLTVNATMAINGGNLTGGSGTMSFVANLNLSSGTFVASGTVTLYDGLSNYIYSGGTADWITNSSTFNTGNTVTLPAQTYYNVSLGRDAALSSGTTTINGNLVTNTRSLAVGANTLTVLGNVTISSSGTITVSTGTINVRGDWTNSGTFTSTGASTVNLNGTGAQAIHGGTSNFYNLTATASSARTLTFDAGSTVGIAAGGTLTLTGASEQLLTLASSAASAWNLNVNDSASYNVTYTSASYIDASGGKQVLLTDGTNVNGGNNTNWVVDLVPNTASSLAQKKTTDTTIETNGWTNETSVKFTASASDSDSSDTLYLCVEKDLLGTAFSDTEDSCGEGVAYSGTPVTLTVTIGSLSNAAEYHWQTRVKDQYNQYSAWSSYGGNAESARDFAVDTSAPTVNPTANPATPNGSNDYYKTTAPTLTLAGSDASSGLASIKYRWGGDGDYSTYSTTLTVPEGTNTLYYYGIDNAGNDGSASPTTTEYKVDTISATTTPTANPATPNGSNNYYKTTVPTITLAGSDAGSGVATIKYRWGVSGDYSTYSTAITAPEGINTLYYYSDDSAGNSASPSTTEYKVDITAPTTNPLAPTSTNSNTGSASFAWQAGSDAISGIAGYLVYIGSISGSNNIVNGSSSTALTYSHEFTQDGTYYFRVKAQDNAGNIGEFSNEGSVVVDAVTPLLAITNLTNDQFISTKTFTITGTSSDTLAGISKVELNIDGAADWVSATSSDGYATWAYDWSGYTEGSHKILARATDLAENIKASSEYIVVVDTTAPAVAPDFRVFNISNSTANVYATYLDFSESKDELSGTKNYEVYRGDSKIGEIAINKDSANKNYTGNTNQPYYFVDSDLSSGSYSYKIKSIDNVGNSIETAAVTINTASKQIENDAISEVKGTASSVISKDKTSAIISWKTVYPATSLVEYGESTSYGKKTEIDTNLNQGHSVLLPDLKPGSTYHAKVTSKDIYGRETTSPDISFTTGLSPEDKSAIQIIIETLQNLFRVLTTQGATTEADMASLQGFSNNLLVTDISFKEKAFYQNILTFDKAGKIEKSTDGKSFSPVSTSGQSYYLDKDLNQGLNYYYRQDGGMPVVRKPLVGDDSPLVVTEAAVIKESVFTTKDKVQLTLFWKTNRGASSQADFGSLSSYGERTKEDVSLNMGHNVTLENLNPDTTYHFKVTSKDAKGLSASSQDFTFTTPVVQKDKSTIDIIIDSLKRALSFTGIN